MGSIRFSRFRSMKSFRRILAFTVTVLAILLVLAFVRYRMQTGSVEKPQKPESSEADLSVKGFNHTATSQGRTSWILSAESARMFSDRNRAELTDVDVTFFTENRSSVHLTAQKGEFNTETKNMSASGSVLGRHKGYILTTESLHYTSESNIIDTDAPVSVAGDSSRFTADSGKFELDTETLILDGHVEVRMNQIDN
ncbi:MAG: LPS export ABC transporter periplasmic protein LptC [Desulfosalsimonas sp.]